MLLTFLKTCNRIKKYSLEFHLWNYLYKKQSQSLLWLQLDISYNNGGLINEKTYYAMPVLVLVYAKCLVGSCRV